MERRRSPGRDLHIVRVLEACFSHEQQDILTRIFIAEWQNLHVRYNYQMHQPQLGNEDGDRMLNIHYESCTASRLRTRERGIENKWNI